MINDIEGYLSKRLDIKTIRLIYSTNNITPEQSDKYKHLFEYVLFKINETYLGYDIMVNDENKIKHFNWCWNNFFNIHKNTYKFLNTEKIKNILYSYFLTSYYNTIDEKYSFKDERELYQTILKNIHITFTLNTYKTKYYIDELLNIHESVNFG